MKKVVYQGARGCFSELAAGRFFDEPIKGKNVSRFEDIFETLKNRKGFLGIIPIENSLMGSLHRNYDLLLEYDCWIIGEVELKITYDLLANHQAKQKAIEEVWSHPIVLEQCRRFVGKHPEFKVKPVYDSAGAAGIIKKNKRLDVAVIAGQGIGQLYGLRTVEQRIEDDPQNFTRFLVISQKKEIVHGKDLKTTLVFGVKNEVGILFRCLSIFALRNIDLTKLESRPIIGKPWEYLFYIDFNGSVEDENCKHAIESLREAVGYVKCLGSYPMKGWSK